MNIVARGQQRFRLRRRWVGVEGAVSMIFKKVSVLLISVFEFSGLIHLNP